MVDSTPASGRLKISKRKASRRVRSRVRTGGRRASSARKKDFGNVSNVKNVSKKSSSSSSQKLTSETKSSTAQKQKAQASTSVKERTEPVKSSSSTQRSKRESARSKKASESPSLSKSRRELSSSRSRREKSVESSGSQRKRQASASSSGRNRTQKEPGERKSRSQRRSEARTNEPNTIMWVAAIVVVLGFAGLGAYMVVSTDNEKAPVVVEEAAKEVDAKPKKLSRSLSLVEKKSIWREANQKLLFAKTSARKKYPDIKQKAEGADQVLMRQKRQRRNAYYERLERSAYRDIANKYGATITQVKDAYNEGVQKDWK